MFYSIQELFKLIDQHKSPSEFYGKFSGGFGINYYINRITRFSPKENRIICGFGEESPLSGLNIEEKSILIEESEAILFLYNLHNEDFMIDRQRSIDDILEFMYSTSGIQNEFWGDIGIIYRNQRKKCYVRTRSGNLVTKDDITEKKIADIKLTYQIELI